MMTQTPMSHAMPNPPLVNKWLRFAHEAAELAAPATALSVSGRLTRVAGLVMEASGLKLPVGATCAIVQADGIVEAEVVGFAGERLFLMPTSEVYGLTPGAEVIPLDAPVAPPRVRAPNEPDAAPRRRVEDRTRQLPMGWGLMGRVVDAGGRPLDGRGPLNQTDNRPLKSRSINPIERAPIRDVMDVGVRAINSLLTIGRGQRIGLFAGTGVGKSVLLGMMAKYTDADVTVVGLIGERGREVKEFIDEILGEEGLKRAVVVAAPADVPPLQRLQAANYATAIAEYYREQGKSVLLLMDSLTRYCMAQREIALAIGEPPATRGYPPSVFAKLPALVERTGNGAPGQGSITAFYTVLSEGDDQQDPIADNARGILDGHIVLSRHLAEQGHYPAIDIEQSISRVMHGITERSHQDAARKLKTMFSRYQRNRDLIAVGAYQPGSDPVLDDGMARYPRIEQFLQQSMHEPAHFDDALNGLAGVLA
jgi:flagellum-specific ATP synthase